MREKRKIWEYNRGYKLGRLYVDLCTKTQFHSLKVEGLENLPKDGALILAPTHKVTLVDPLVILTAFPGQPVVFGARSDIFAKPKVAAILRWLRILPIARERNGRTEVMKNISTFDEAVDVIANGVPFCMFAEGTHHPAPGMLPVKKGVFRLAKMAMDKLQTKVYVVPIGLDYEYYFQTKGRMVMRIGESIEVGEHFNSDLPEAEIYRSLCEDLQTRCLGLIDRYSPAKPLMGPHVWIAAILSLPVFALCLLCSLLIWLPAYLLNRKMKDKAWAPTVIYGFRFFLPVLWPFYSVMGLLRNFYFKLLPQRQESAEL